MNDSEVIKNVWKLN